VIILRLARRPLGYVAKHAGQTLYPTFGGANVAFRKACLAEVGGFDPMIKLGEDTDICALLDSEGHPAFEKESIALMKCWTGSPRTVCSVSR